jgi:hypothetical protein
MADQLLTAEAVAEQLQISKEQVLDLMKKGLLRGFLDQKTYKFRPADIQAYRKKLESGVTNLSDEEGALPSTSRINLDDIESEVGVDEADQTSVLPSAGATEPTQAPGAPVFQFSEQDLGIKDEEAEELDEGDQTSLLGPIDEADAEAGQEPAPAFDFSEKDLDLGDEEGGESVLVADESESSVDILEVSDESSSESATTTSSAIFAEESSGDEIPAAEIKEEVASKERSDKTVTDILGGADEEGEEDLDSLDLEEVVETGPAQVEEAATMAEEDYEEAAPATVGLGSEFGTADIAEEEPGGVSESEDEALIPATAGVDEAIAEAVGEQVELPSSEEEEGEQMVMPSGWEIVVPSRLGNGLLIAATVMLVVAGLFVFCNMGDIKPAWAQPLIDFVQQNL